MTQLVDLSDKLNASGYVWAVINYADGTFWAVVRPNGPLAEWLGDGLGYNYQGESYTTPEKALEAAAASALLAKIPDHPTGAST